MQIRTIDIHTNEYEDMKALRIRVLLDPIGVPHTYVNPEKEQHDILIGAFEEERLIGCCVLTRRDENTLQLRQMAVDDKVQKRGTGTAIVAYAEAVAKEQGYRVLMMHARDAVMDFYRKSGYTIVGDQFFEVGIPHHIMTKQLA